MDDGDIEFVGELVFPVVTIIPEPVQVTGKIALEFTAGLQAFLAPNRVNPDRVMRIVDAGADRLADFAAQIGIFLFMLNLFVDEAGYFDRLEQFPVFGGDGMRIPVESVRNEIALNNVIRYIAVIF